MLKINTFDLSEILLYFSIWVTLYFLLCVLNATRSYEWHCRTVTVIHAVLITFLALYCMYVIGPWPFTHAGGPNSPEQIRIVGLCLGYFLFDLGWCLYFKTEGPVMLAHHFLSIVGLSWCLIAGAYGTELVATIGGAEMTNPLLQLRWFMRNTGCYKTLWGDVVDITFMCLFGFVRIILGSMLLYSYFQQDTDFWGRVGGVSIYLIGWIFFVGILNYAVKKYVRRFRVWLQKDRPSPNNCSTPLYDCDMKDNVGLISQKEIPTQREIKDGSFGLSLRKNCLIQGSIDS